MSLKSLSRRLALILLASVFVAPAFAHEIKTGDLKISHPWVRATAMGGTFAAGYVKITNTGKTPEILLGATIEGAKAGEVHETLIDANGVASMKMLADGVVIPPGGSIQLKPEAMHIMFSGLEKPLMRDTEVDGTLLLQHAGAVKVTFFVEPPGASEPTH